VTLRSLSSQTTSRDCIEIFTKPGQPAFTQMHTGASSRASACVQPNTANLLAKIMCTEQRADLRGQRSRVYDYHIDLTNEIPIRNLVPQKHAANIDVEIKVPFFVGEVECPVGSEQITRVRRTNQM
jgi:hypothetical protein